MPECVKCNKKAKLNPGDLCKSCYAALNNPKDDDELIAGISARKSLSELNVGDLVNIMQHLIKPVNDQIDQIRNNVKTMQDGIENNDNEIKLLKDVIVEQQKAIDGFYKEKRENNLIISGVLCQDDEVIRDKVQLIFDKLECTSGTMDDVESVYRIGRKVTFNDDGREDARRIMLKFNSKKAKYEVLRKTKLLKNWTQHKDRTLGNNDIFINHDESPMTRKENLRLRKERNRLRNLDENKNKKVVIYKGKLTVDGNPLDEFNIENQLITSKNF